MRGPDRLLTTKWELIRAKEASVTAACAARSGSGRGRGGCVCGKPQASLVTGCTPGTRNISLARNDAVNYPRRTHGRNRRLLLDCTTSRQERSSRSGGSGPAPSLSRPPTPDERKAAEARRPSFAKKPPCRLHVEERVQPGPRRGWILFWPEGNCPVASYTGDANVRAGAGRVS